MPQFNRRQIEDEVCDEISERSGFGLKNVHLTDELVVSDKSQHDLGLDARDIVEIAGALEEYFGIEISDAETDVHAWNQSFEVGEYRFGTVGWLCDLVQKKLGTS